MRDYFNNLNSALIKLGVSLEEEGYGEEHFMKEIKDRYMSGIFFALFIMPILLDAGKAVDHTLKDQDPSYNIEKVENGKDFKFYPLITLISPFFL